MSYIFEHEVTDEEREYAFSLVFGTGWTPTSVQDGVAEIHATLAFSIIRWCDENLRQGWGISQHGVEGIDVQTITIEEPADAILFKLTHSDAWEEVHADD